MACPGDTITLSWRTNGNVTLSAEPEVPGLGKRDASGRETVTLPGGPGPTVFGIHVSRFFGLKKTDTSGEVLSPPLAREYAVVDAEGEADFSCLDQERAVEAFIVLDEEKMSPGVLIEQVTNMNVRRLVLGKDGVSKTLEEGEAAGFEGMPAQGRWSLRVPLEEGENCETAVDDVDGRLIIKLQLACRR
ncbi:MAG TPA: hypothetical protein VF794_33590 [Archangium sp.]|uniref:hypothetical protein n=1 Tax=Archangium sp. TaxID=1872627 RepID=UPI002ED85028